MVRTTPVACSKSRKSRLYRGWRCGPDATGHVGPKWFTHPRGGPSVATDATTENVRTGCPSRAHAARIVVDEKGIRMIGLALLVRMHA